MKTKAQKASMFHPEAVKFMRLYSDVIETKIIDGKITKFRGGKECTVD